MKDLFKQFTLNNVISGLVSIVIGVLFIIMPYRLAHIMVVITGIFLLLGAGACLFTFFWNRSYLDKYGLAGAIVLTIAGIYTLTHVYTILGVLNIFFGIFIICFGSIFVARSIDDLMRTRSSVWLPQLIISVVTVAIGTVILFGTFSTIFKFTGYGLVVAGVLIIVMTLVFGNRVKKEVNKHTPMDAEWRETD